MIIPIQTDANHADEMVREIHKCEHIFRAKKLNFRFGVCKESDLPLLIDSPLDFPPASRYLSFFGQPDTLKLMSICTEFDPIAHRVQTRWENPPKSSEFSLRQIFAAETIAHSLRHTATLEPNFHERRQMCTAATAIYEFALLSCTHTGITNIVRNITENATKEKCTLFSAVVDLDKIVEPRRRLISHCFAGMAVCALIGERSPVQFFLLSSAALSLEPKHTLELGALLRVLLLMVGTFEMKLKSLGCPIKQTPSEWKFDAHSKDKVMDLMDSSICKLPDVYRRMTAIIMLPLVLRRGTTEMVNMERLLIAPRKWDETLACALAINRRILDRASGAIPAPKVITVTHIIGSQIVERVCGHCGKWQEDRRPFARCSKCMLVYYCSKECQKDDWKNGHQSVCKTKSLQ